jgi:hypothetical protein
MARCPSCDYPLPSDRERLGARCPSCRDPLYDPPGRVSRPAREGEAACAVHPGNESIGTCARCGNYICAVCRSSWRDQVVCAACVDRALETREAAPEQVRAHARQALLSLVLGLVAWVVAGLSFLAVVLLAAAQGEVNAVLGFLLLAGFLCAAVVALFGVGQGSAALRTRGDRMILATFGLILSGLFVGVLVGLFSFSIWQM